MQRNGESRVLAYGLNLIPGGRFFPGATWPYLNRVTSDLRLKFAQEQFLRKPPPPTRGGGFFSRARSGVSRMYRGVVVIKFLLRSGHDRHVPCPAGRTLPPACAARKRHQTVPASTGRDLLPVGPILIPRFATQSAPRWFFPVAHGPCPKIFRPYPFQSFAAHRVP